MKSDKLELLSLRIKPKNAKSLIFVCWYRPPTSVVDDAAFENLREILAKLDKVEMEIILVGDTNCDIMDHKNANTKKLKLVYAEYQLEQLIKSYTRVAVTTTEQGDKRVSKSLIDHFSTSNSKFILKADVLETGMVDHYMVYGVRKVNAWRLKKEHAKPKLVESRNMKQYDKALFLNDLQQIDWKTILDPLSSDPSGMTNTFQEIFESILNIHAPMKRRRVRSEFAPWLTPIIRKSMATRDRLKKMATQNPEMWSLYTKQRNRVTKEIRNSIQDHYKNLINESNGDPKKMWKTINRVLDKDVKSTNLSAIESEGKTLTKEHDMLEALNRHFVSVGPNLAKQISSKSDDDCLKHIIPENSEMLFQTVDEEYVLNAINRPEKGKASGPDKVTITLVKDAASSIAYPLMLIYNASLMNGIFPDIWKLARVTPIYKSGPKSDTNNYRPISVISVFSRMLERLTHDQLFEFLKTNKRLTSNQAAFRKHYSTITSLIGSTDYWYESIDHSKVNLTVFLDLKKAFDTVDHSVLMKKLRAYGVRDKSGDWFESYLTNRKQFCSLNGLHSKAKKVTCGIPQGSCLGPLLFIIYLNDLEECLQFSRASIYADDTSLTIASSNSVKLVDDAHRELLNISEWMRVNKLSPNPKKTEFMVIGHPLKTRSLDPGGGYSHCGLTGGSSQG